MNFDNEWVESSMARAAQRVLAGETLYPPPSVEFVGDNYPPAYFFLYAGMMKVFGSSLAAGRAISLVAMACIALAIWRISSGNARMPLGDDAPTRKLEPVSSIHAPRTGRLALVALFLAFYAAGGQVYDLARADMTAIAFAAWAVVLLTCTDCARSAVLAGLLMAAAILTKHNTVMIGACIGAGLLFLQPKRAIVYGLLAAGLPAVVFAWLHSSSDGWSSYYLFTQPAMHPFGGGSRWIRFLFQDVSQHGFLLASGVGAGALFILTTRKTVRADSARPGHDNGRQARETAEVGADMRLILLLLAAAGGIGVTLLGRLKAGGFSNNLVPAWVFGLLAASGTWPMVRERAIRFGYSLRRVERAFWIAVAGISLSLVKSYTEIDWQRWLAIGARREAADKLDKRIASLSAYGPVWMPYHSFDASSACGFAHLCPAGFLMNDASFPAKSLFEQDVARQLERRTWAAIVLDGDEERFVSDRCTELLAAGYAEFPVCREIADGCLALTGKRTSPRRVYIRRSEPAAMSPQAALAEPGATR